MLLGFKHWVFDMDGTLTIAKHDFDAIRMELGLPKDMPILEAIDLLDKNEATRLHAKLSAIELDIAHQSQAAEGAHELLSQLTSRGVNLGILTRNNAQNIEVTLNAANLNHFFDKRYLLSRDCALPKPAPDGIQRLLNEWQGENHQAVMVGDHMHDLRAGKAAGIQTIYIDPDGQFPFKKEADQCITSLLELLH